MSTCQNPQKNVMVGELPQDFLRVGGGPVQQQVFADQQAAAAMQAAHGGFTFMTPNLARLSITVCQGKLTKNYGLMKMDLYCRLRVGQAVFETPTANGAGKNPHWNKIIHCHIPPGVDSIYLEVFDEKAFTMDDRVAWGHITIPEKVFSCEVVDDWWHLNGRQGDRKEGMINLILSYAPPGQVPQVAIPQPPLVYATPGGAPIMMMPSAVPVCPPAQVGGVVTMQQPQMQQPQMQQPQMQQPQMQQPQMQQQQQFPQFQQLQQPLGPLFTDEDVSQVKDMFPNVEVEVIKSVLEANNGNKDATINSLLNMDS